MKQSLFLGVVSIALFVLSFLWKVNSIAMPILLETQIPTIMETPMETPVAPIVKPPEMTITRDYQLIDDNADGITGDVGDKISLSIIYKNNSEDTLNNVVILDDYPEDLLSEISNTGGGVDNQSTITWNVGTVGPVQEGQLSYEIKLKDKYPNTPISHDFVAQISGEGFVQKDSKFTVPFNLPILDLSKSFNLISDMNSNSIIDPGDTVRFIIKYTNKGNADATHVTIRDDYNEKMMMIENITGSGNNDGKVITWDLGLVKAGNTGTVSYDAKLSVEAFNFGLTEIQNQAVISSNEIEDQSANASIKVNVPTPTPTPTPSLTPTLTPAATQTPTPVSTPIPSEGPRSGIFYDKGVDTLLVVSLISFIAMAALFVSPSLMRRVGITGEDYKESLEVLRHGIFLVFIVFAVLILALGGGVKEDGAISLLSAIVGYLFGKGTGKTVKD